MSPKAVLPCRCAFTWRYHKVTKSSSPCVCSWAQGSESSPPIALLGAPLPPDTEDAPGSREPLPAAARGARFTELWSLRWEEASLDPRVAVSGSLGGGTRRDCGSAALCTRQPRSRSSACPWVLSSFRSTGWQVAGHSQSAALSPPAGVPWVGAVAATWWTRCAAADTWAERSAGPHGAAHHCPTGSPRKQSPSYSLESGLA